MTYNQLPTAPNKNPYPGRCGAKAMCTEVTSRVYKLFKKSQQRCQEKPAKMSRTESNVIIDSIVGSDIIADNQMVELTTTSSAPLNEVNTLLMIMLWNQQVRPIMQLR